MNFSLLVQAAPTNQGAFCALRFGEAVVAANHKIERVFFYHDGVLTANKLQIPPQDERNISAGWSELAENNDIELAVCIAASLKRGIVNEVEASRYALSAYNLNPAFTIVGLGQLIDAMVNADKFITFTAC